MAKSIFLTLFFAISLVHTQAAIIKVGDILDVTVKNHTELSMKVQVEKNGFIDYPLYQDELVAGMSTSELTEAITLKLVKHFPDPFVVITRSNDILITVSVFGEIKHPGLYEIPSRSTIQEVLFKAGGPSDFARLDSIILVRENDKTVNIQFEKFLESGDLSLLPPLKNNDKFVILSGTSGVRVKVIGEVAKQGSYSITKNFNVFDAIYDAGGPLTTANLNRVQHVSYENGVKVVNEIPLQRLIDAGLNEKIPHVKGGDTIIVRKKSFTWRQAMDGIRDLVTIIAAYGVIVNLGK